MTCFYDVLGICGVNQEALPFVEIQRSDRNHALGFIRNIDNFIYLTSETRERSTMLCVFDPDAL